MKKRVFNNLSDFYKDITNDTNAFEFNYFKEKNRKDFYGISMEDIEKYKHSYPTGVAMLKHLKDFKVEKYERIKYYNSFDGFDIDVDRMYDGDFLIDNKKKRKLPKVIDVFVNISENANVDYSEMLQKTYATLKVVDHLESLGVRVGVFCCMALRKKYKSGHYAKNTTLIEISVKKPEDSVNLGALCTSISPWFFRYHGFQYLRGKEEKLASTIGYGVEIPRSEIPKNAIVIETGQCLNEYESNNFIENIKVN